MIHVWVILGILFVVGSWVFLQWKLGKRDAKRREAHLHKVRPTIAELLAESSADGDIPLAQPEGGGRVNDEIKENQRAGISTVVIHGPDSSEMNQVEELTHRSNVSDLQSSTVPEKSMKTNEQPGTVFPEANKKPTISIIQYQDLEAADQSADPNTNNNVGAVSPFNLSVKTSDTPHPSISPELVKAGKSNSTSPVRSN